MIDQNQIEHDQAKVTELQHSEALRQLKETNDDFLLDPEKAHQIFDNPSILYKKQEEPVVKPQIEPEPVVKKDPIDTFIEKLYNQMKSSKHFPNSLRELEK